MHWLSCVPVIYALWLAANRVRIPTDLLGCTMYGSKKIRTCSCTAQYCTTLQYGIRHYTTLHYTTLHYSTLHYTAYTIFSPHSIVLTLFLTSLLTRFLSTGMKFFAVALARCVLPLLRHRHAKVIQLFSLLYSTLLYSTLLNSTQVEVQFESLIFYHIL